MKPWISLLVGGALIVLAATAVANGQSLSQLNRRVEHEQQKTQSGTSQLGPTGHSAMFLHNGQYFNLSRGGR